MKKISFAYNKLLFLYTLNVVYFSEFSFAAATSEPTQTGNNTSILLSFITPDLFINIFFACLVVILTLFLAKLLTSKLAKILENSYIGMEGGKEELIGVLTRTINIIILSIGFAVTLTVLGIDMGIFLGGLGFGIGFTLKIFLTNFIAGILMVTQGFYHLGDLVKVGGKTGTIKNIHSLFTAIEQFDGVIFYVPNVKFLEEEITNYHTNSIRRVDIKIGVDYSTDIVKAKEIMLNVTKLFPNILKVPETDVIIGEMKDSSILLNLRFWMDSKDTYFELKSNVTETVNMAFRKEGIIIPFPQITISNRSEIKK